MAKRTNEWEFQGEVNSWFNAEIASRAGMQIERSTLEPPIGAGRNDLVVWRNRGSLDVLLTIELKTPSTPINDAALLIDACRKAQARKAPYFAIWNMQVAELYRTPPGDGLATPADRLKAWPVDPLVTRVADWLESKPAASLQVRALELLDKAWELSARGEGQAPQRVDATVFVEILADSLGRLRAAILPDLKERMARDSDARRRLDQLAAAQGFKGFVPDLNVAIAGQFAYRLVGQILFYHALSRRQPALGKLVIDDARPLAPQLRHFWDDVRRFDYEALFEKSDLESLVPLGKDAQRIVRDLVRRLSEYEWSALPDDVLGSVFESLIPREEQHLLGQFYTRRPVSDLLVAFALDGDRPLVLDPGCGSGTFLLSAYEWLRERQGVRHADALSLIWGFDISAFAAELAVINLFRQDLSTQENFPRVVSGDFFERKVGERRSFPPARREKDGEAVVPIPRFGAVVGNPPYLRSQSQDDLDPEYRSRLFLAARAAGVEPAAKTDLFAFFVYQALDFLLPGGTLAFVTSSSWLTADFGVSLQRVLTTQFRLVAIVASSAESFFTQVDVNTVLVIAKRRAADEPHTSDPLRFVTLKRRLDELFPRDEQYWERLVAFVDRVASAVASSDSKDWRITVKPPAPVRSVLAGTDDRSNWSLYLRAPTSFFRLFPEA